MRVLVDQEPRIVNGLRVGWGDHARDKEGRGRRYTDGGACVILTRLPTGWRSGAPRERAGFPGRYSG